MGVTRITKLADEERARFNEWADRWIDIGLRTGPADRARFESAVRECYRYAGIEWPGVVVWVPSPLVLALAAPAAAVAIETILAQSRRPAGKRAPTARSVAVHGAVDVAVRGAVDGAVRDAVHGAVHDAVGGAVRGAVDGAVDDAVGDAVHGAVHDAVGGAVHVAVDDAVGDAVHVAVGGAVDGAVRGAVGGAVGDAVHVAVGGAVGGAVHDAVHGAVGGAVDGAVRGAVDGAVGGAVHDAVDVAVARLRRADQNEIQKAVSDAIRRSWSSYIGGQLWAGGWYYGGAYTSFFREVCQLELTGDLWNRGRAYEATIESACWWWPHQRFVMVCERPTVINRELTDPSRARGWGSHRLHCDDGPAVAWPDGWGVWAIHGVRVTRQIVEAPETLSVAQIRDEQNAEVRRIMLARFGEERFIRELGAQPIHSDDVGDLYRVEVPDDEPLVMVRVLNSTPEADGSIKPYWLRVPPDMTQARQAIAWTFGLQTSEYAPAIET